MSNSLQPYRLQPTRLLHPWDLPGKSTGVGAISKGFSNMDIKPEPVTILLGPWSTASRCSLICILGQKVLAVFFVPFRHPPLDQMKGSVHCSWVSSICRASDKAPKSWVLQTAPQEGWPVSVMCLHVCARCAAPPVCIPQPCSSETGSWEQGGQEPHEI